MYQLGLKPRLQRRWPLWLGIGTLFLIVFISAAVFVLRSLKPSTTVSTSAAVTTKVTATTSPLKLFNQPGFSLQLPSDWKLVEHLTQPYDLYRFKGGSKATVNQLLDVYQDVMPVNFAVNRAQQVEADGEHMASVGNVSDNCAQYTRGSTTLGMTGSPAKWQDTDFLCDLNNTSRNVVGISATGAINTVVLKGPDGHPHKFFMTYTDNTINPNYSTLDSAISTFSAN